MQHYLAANVDNDVRYKRSIYFYELTLQHFLMVASQHRQRFIF